MASQTRKIIVDELHKPARRNFARRRVKLLGINDLMQADLVEMQPFARINRGMRYILTAINCTTKFGYAIPVKNKTGASVAAALEKIFSHTRFRYLQADDGKEWYNTHVKKLLKKYNIVLYSSFSEKKASIVERFNRTLKSKMYKYFTLQNSDKWIDILPTLIDEYNNSYHRTIQMRPNEVGPRNIAAVLRNIRKNTARPTTPLHKRLKQGDKVRISKYKGIFAKGYKANWTNEIFTIAKVKSTKPATYELKDFSGQLIKGGFYREELQKTEYGDVYLIEKILARRGDRVKVLWQGFDGKQTSWIDRKSIV